MTPAQRAQLADETVAATLRRLPPAVRDIAARVPVVHHDWPSEEILGDEFEPDILGMFVGRLGPLTIAVSVGRQSETRLARYPEEEVIVG
jgi:predicted Zn-dependent protease with MMP-like domain